MLRFPILIASLASLSVVYGADHNTFKNCSRISFCTNLRGKTVETASQFEANLFELKKNDRTVVIPLTNSNDEVLNLEITLFRSNTARIRIYEENHTRFELPYVLESEPVPIPFSDVNVANKTLTLTPLDYPYPYLILVKNGPPFSVEFYVKDQLEVVLNADNLIMENTEDSKAFSFKVEFEGASRLYGLSEHAYKLGLDETTNSSTDPFRLRNSDVYQYEVASPMALYGSIPVLYGHSIHSTSGIFIHNAAEEWIDISYKNRPSANFIIESGVLDFFVFLGPDPQSVVRQYTALVGVAPLPQLWTLGYHQCRFTYESQEDVKTVVANMIKYDFPMDVLWLDDGHSNGNRYFEWNPQNFTDPIEMQKNVSAVGKKFVSISDPHIKIADDYPVYTEAKGKYFVKWANGSDYEGECWPGMSSYIDFLNPEASDYYSGWYAYNKFNQTTETLAGIWNDMNEPSVFDDSLEKTLPFEVLHYGDVPHRDVHNIYGFLQTRATHEGLLRRDNHTKRPFILTRSFFAGSQRYAAIWTGDNAADWSYLSTSLSQCLTANIIGMVYCGADVGGFETEPTEELLQRWYQAAVWLPFYRGHSGKETPRREPYLFPDNVQSVIRNALKLRYKHIPVFYTLGFEHSIFGDPIIRPLFYEYYDLLDFDDHVLLGRDILARPVLEAGVETVKVTFPGDGTYWYRVDDDSFEVHHGGTTEDISVNITLSPFFYRGGSIIARKDIEKLSTTYMMNDPYTLYINVDSNNLASGHLYVDDYTSFEYETNDSFIYILFEYLPDSHGVRIHQIDGDSTGIDILLQRIVIHEHPGNGTKKNVPTTYTTTADGTPLDTINIVQHLKLRRNSEDLILYL